MSSVELRGQGQSRYLLFVGLCYTQVDFVGYNIYFEQAG